MIREINIRFFYLEKTFKNKFELKKIFGFRLGSFYVFEAID
jgi:hypothetical protein